MTTTTNPWDLGSSETGNSFPFDRHGDSVTGRIIDMVEQQQTDLQTGEPKTFANGQPMLMYRVTLATALRDPANPLDDGHRNVYLKGSRKPDTRSSLAAVLEAVTTTTGGTALEPNATLTLTCVGGGRAGLARVQRPQTVRSKIRAPHHELGRTGRSPRNPLTRRTPRSHQSPTSRLPFLWHR